MSASSWRDRCDAYVALRRALGFTMRPEQRVLRDFVAFLERHHRTDTVPAHAAVTWATTTTRPVSPGRHAHRLSIARQFLTYGHAFEPGVEIPAYGLLRGARRPRPHLFTPQEVRALMDAAHQLGPRDALRPHTVETIIGLLASCGLRGSEAIHLTVDEVDLGASPPRLIIQQTKFRKSRIVPVHATTADALRTYAAWRDRLGYDGLCHTFFVSEGGTPLNYHVLARTFVALARRLGIRGPADERGASLHQLRHTFAVDRLAAWARAGGNVRDRVPALAVYLGHARPENTYWYLTSSPQVLHPAGEQFETYVTNGSVAP